MKVIVQHEEDESREQSTSEPSSSNPSSLAVAATLEQQHYANTGSGLTTVIENDPPSVLSPHVTNENTIATGKALGVKEDGGSVGARESTARIQDESPGFGTPVLRDFRKETGDSHGLQPQLGKKRNIEQLIGKTSDSPDAKTSLVDSANVTTASKVARKNPLQERAVNPNYSSSSSSSSSSVRGTVSSLLSRPTTSVQRTPSDILLERTKVKKHNTVGRSSHFERRLKAKGLELKRMKGDGNCLFRAVSLQIYGDAEWHGEIRKHVVKYLNTERSYFAQFITDDYDLYISRMSKDGCYGSNPEIQAIVEVYNRAVEVYEYPSQPQSHLYSSSSSSLPEDSLVSSSSSSSNRLRMAENIRPMNTFQCSYTTGNPPLRLAYVNGNHYDAIIDPYEASIGVGLGLPGFNPGNAEKKMMKKAFEKSVKGMDSIYMNKTKYLSDREATEIALQEAAIRESLRDFWDKQNAQQKQDQNSKRLKRKSPVVSERQDRVSPYKRKRSDTNRGQNMSGSSSSDAEKKSENKLLSDFAVQQARLTNSDYPPIVEELVCNGFALENVLKAHAIAGDNFDALLSLLLRNK